MQGELQVAVCQRCGRGFVLTHTYRGFLERWGRPVIVPVLCPSCFLEEGPLPKRRGEVKWFSTQKRYGFIAAGEDKDVFFHEQQLLGEADTAPHTGQHVRFHVRRSPKGPEALNVEIKE